MGHVLLPHSDNAPVVTFLTFFLMRLTAGSRPKADVQSRIPLELEQAFCVYLACRRSPLFLSVCDKPNSSETNKKIAASLPVN